MVALARATADEQNSFQGQALLCFWSAGRSRPYIAHFPTRNAGRRRRLRLSVDVIMMVDGDLNRLDL